MKIQKLNIKLIMLALLMLASCKTKVETKTEKKMEYKKGTFGYDLMYLSKYNDIFTLSDDKKKSQLIISPELQGRIMTSTANGHEGQSFGWINYDFFESGGPISDHFNPYGGEERFWLGPEGGQFSIYFEKGKPFEFENWFVPKEIDTEPFKLLSKTSNTAFFEKKMNLTNYAGFTFDFMVKRNIRLFNKEEISEILEHQISGLDFVGYETENILINTGEESWNEETGMMSIWILCMLAPAPGVHVVIPYKPGSVNDLGPVVNDDYFGKVGNDRLKILDSTLIFMADGKYRSKIGIPPKRAKAFCGSYDQTNKVLTIANYSIHEGNNEYVKSQWKIHDHPFRGDLVNAYNDGPVDDGSQMGPFYEIESSSPATRLNPREKMVHFHRMFHFIGDKEKLNAIAVKLLGISLEDIENAFRE
jgi:hypothetical protein